MGGDRSHTGQALGLGPDAQEGPRRVSSYLSLYWKADHSLSPCHRRRKVFGKEGKGKKHLHA